MPNLSHLQADRRYISVVATTTNIDVAAQLGRPARNIKVFFVTAGDTCTVRLNTSRVIEVPQISTANTTVQSWIPSTDPQPQQIVLNTTLDGNQVLNDISIDSLTIDAIVNAGAAPTIIIW